jgi:hypothetical protein
VGDRLRLALSLSIPPMAGVLIAAVWWPGVIFALLVAAYAAAHVVTIPSDASRRVSLSAAVAGATALMSGGSLVLVLGPAAVALPIGWLIVHVRYGKRVTQSMFPAEAVGIVAFAAAFAAMLLLVPSTDPAHPLILTTFAGAALLGFLMTVVTNAIVSEERRVVARRLIALRAFDDWPAYAALLSSAALLAVTADPMGAWSAPLAGLPYLFSHVSLHRLALGAIPEASGQVSAGHSSRTAELAVAVGAEIGLGTSELRRLEYAALLHDIGRVVLANPAVARGTHSSSDVAGWSAAIIGEARHLERVAHIVALQHAPYRKEGEVRDNAVPRTSQLVRITARYDVALDEGISPLAALELMHRGAAYDYDPEVVMALRRVLERRGSLAA